MSSEAAPPDPGPDHAPEPGPGPVVEGDAWLPSPTVSIRPEPFGALVYDFATRRLSFLKSLTLLDVVQRLAGSATVGRALDDAGVTAAERSGYLAALNRLADTGLIRPRDPNRDPDGVS